MEQSEVQPVTPPLPKLATHLTRWNFGNIFRATFVWTIVWLLLVGILPDQPRWSTWVPWGARILAIDVARSSLICFCETETCQLQVLDLNTGKLRLQLDHAASPEVSSPGRAICWGVSGDGRYWASLRNIESRQELESKELIVADLTTGEILLRKAISDVFRQIVASDASHREFALAGPNRIRLNQDGTRIALFARQTNSGDYRNATLVFEVASGEILFKHAAAPDWGPTSCGAFSSDGTKVLVRDSVPYEQNGIKSRKCVLRWFDVSSGRSSSTFVPQFESARRAELVGVSGLVIVDSEGKPTDIAGAPGSCTQVFDIPTGRVQHTFPQEWLKSIDTDGRAMLLSTSELKVISEIIASSEPHLVRGIVRQPDSGRELAQIEVPQETFVTSSVSMTNSVPIVTGIRSRSVLDSDWWVRWSRTEGQTDLIDLVTQRKVLCAIGVAGHASPDRKYFANVARPWLSDLIDNAASRFGRRWNIVSNQYRLLHLYVVPAGRPYYTAAIWTFSLYILYCFFKKLPRWLHFGAKYCGPGGPVSQTIRAN